MDQHDIDRLSEILIERLQDVRRRSTQDELPALDTITRSLVDLGIADDAGVTEVDAAGDFRSIAATSPLVLAVDRAQHDVREGPCVEASLDVTATLSSPDVRRDPRWPTWGPEAARLGVGAVISVRLYAAESASLGALGLYFHQPRAFTAEDLDVARTAASHMSVELVHRRNDANLWQAIDARHRIGQAQGILMERFKIDDTAAFAVLRRISQHQNTKLAIVADTLVRTRELPDSEEDSLAG